MGGDSPEGGGDLLPDGGRRGTVDTVGRADGDDQLHIALVELVSQQLRRVGRFRCRVLETPPADRLLATGMPKIAAATMTRAESASTRRGRGHREERDSIQHAASPHQNGFNIAVKLTAITCTVNPSSPPITTQR